MPQPAIPLSTDPGVADVLFTPLQRSLFGMLFGRPEVGVPADELQLLADRDPVVVGAELERLKACGLVLAADMDGTACLRANPCSPVFHELCALVWKTVGLCVPLHDALMPLVDVIDLAAVDGAVARGALGAEDPVDLIVVAEGLDGAALRWTLKPVEVVIGRPVNTVLCTPATFDEQRREPDSLVARVMSGKPVILLDGLCDWGGGDRGGVMH